MKDRGIMGNGEDEVKEVEILGRRIRWTREGIEYEGDGSHRRALMEEMGLGQDSNAVGCPAERPEGRPSGDDEVELREAERRGFRSMAAKLNYIGQDRSDVQYAARGVCSGMAKPSVGDMRRLKRAVRYLVGAEGVTWEYGEWRDGEEVRVDVYVDSDWAKEASRKSTSGGMLAVGGCGGEAWVEDPGQQGVECWGGRILRLGHRLQGGIGDAVAAEGLRLGGRG